MDKVQITDGGIYQSLERCQSHSLEYASPQKTIIVKIAPSCPRAADDHQEVP